MIIVEGPDAAGKSTLVDFIAHYTGWPIQRSEGPPKYPGEMNDRVRRYCDLPADTIFDRHPVISQPIYGSLRTHHDRIHPPLIKETLDRAPTIIYCDPPHDAMDRHIRSTVDTDHHLDAVRSNFAHITSLYRMWAIHNAHIMYRIGDDASKILRWLTAFNPEIDMRQFHQRFGLEYTGSPRWLPEEISNFRYKFLEEELEEYARARTHEKAFDALIDLVYVAIGTSYLHGFPFQKGWQRVHAANMKKVRATRPDDSLRGSSFDVVKPNGWTAPDLSDLVR